MKAYKHGKIHSRIHSPNFNEKAVRHKTHFINTGRQIKSQCTLFSTPSEYLFHNTLRFNCNIFHGFQNLCYGLCLYRCTLFLIPEMLSSTILTKSLSSLRIQHWALRKNRGKRGQATCSQLRRKYNAAYSQRSPYDRKSHL